VLCGQGADEPWAGYHRYIGIKLSQLYAGLPSALTGAIARLVDRFGSNERLIRGAHSLAEKDVLTRILKVYSFFNSDMKGQMFQPWLKDAIGADESLARETLAYLHRDVQELDPVSQMTYIDTRASLPDDLLMVADKLSMANSVEARVPYLDYRLVEFVESLPPHLKLRGFQGKYLHKKALTSGSRARWPTVPRRASRIRSTNGCAGACAASSTIACSARRRRCTAISTAGTSAAWSRSTRPVGRTICGTSIS
jgi:asparagine synthase (glutamine-hydrolysing)